MSATAQETEGGGELDESLDPVGSSCEGQPNAQDHQKRGIWPIFLCHCTNRHKTTSWCAAWCAVLVNTDKYCIGEIDTCRRE